VLFVSQTQDVHRHIASLLDTMRSVAQIKGPDGELPVKERPESHGTGGPFGGSGFGGGMGGMGGMGGFFGDGAARASADGPFGPMPVERTDSRDASAGLLKGLQDTKNRLQGREVDKLQRIYNQGMGGMGGGMGMGGMF
jgi:hypothetical protein